MRFRALMSLVLAFLLLLQGADLPAAAAHRRPSPVPTQVAYIAGGALWVRPLPAGEPRRLTEPGERHDISHPRWSPSGRWLMLRQEGGFRFFLLEQGISPPLLRGEHAVWSPARDVVAYLDEAGRLRVADPFGRLDRTVAEPMDDAVLGPPRWSPDGRWLAYATFRRGGPQGPSTAVIWRVPSEGGRPREVLRMERAEPFCLELAGWTTDGRWLLYHPLPLCSSSLRADGAALMAVPAGGGEPRPLVDQMLLHPDFLAPAPAGARLALVEGGGRITWTDKRIVLVDVDTGIRRILSPDGLAAISPAWSGDGRRVAFAAMPDLGPEPGGEEIRRGLMEREVWVAGAPLLEDPAFRSEAPHWTPSGWLFARPDARNQASLWLAAPAGLVRLTGLDAPPDAGLGFYGWLDWSSRFAIHSFRAAKDRVG